MSRNHAAIEARVRRLATKFDLRLEKSRHRDPDHPSFGGYELIDTYRNFAVIGVGHWAYDASLEDVCAYLKRVADDDNRELDGRGPEGHKAREIASQAAWLLGVVKRLEELAA